MSSARPGGTHAAPAGGDVEVAHAQEPVIHSRALSHDPRLLRAPRAPCYPVTTGLGARGVILTPALAVARALAWLPAVLRALALMVRDTA